MTTLRLTLNSARPGSKKYRCLLGFRVHDGGIPPAHGKKRKQKNHVNRRIDRENILLRRSLGDVDQQLVACAAGDFGRSYGHKRKHGWKRGLTDSRYA